MTPTPPAFLPALARLFADGHNLVFWNDADGEFTQDVDSLALDNVTVLRLDEIPLLKVKRELEAAPAANWLLYSPAPVPEPMADWLLDARLRGKTFSADTASMQLDELGLASHALRPHLKLRAKFLRAKDRVERLKRWVDQHDTAADLDRKMLAVLARADTPDAAGIFLKVFAALAADGADLNAAPKPLAEIVSNELEPAFWALAEQEFGYATAPITATAAEPPSLRGLLYRLLVTDFVNALGAAPAALKLFVIADRTRAAHASVFASRWRSDMANYASYDKLASAVAEELHITALLGSRGRDGRGGIAKLLLGQGPESGFQLVADYLGQGLGRCVQVGPVCGQGSKNSQKNASRIRRVGPGQHRQHLAVQVCGSVLRIHPALEALHPILGTHELGTLLQVCAQCVAGQAELVQLHRRCICTEGLAAQASIQQPVGHRLRHWCRAVQQPAGGGGSFQLPLHFEQRGLIQTKHGDVVQRQAVHILGELAVGVVPKNQVVAFGIKAGQSRQKSG